MNATAWIRIVAITALGFSWGAHAECPFPKAPASIPDGKTASQEDMMAAMNAFKAYNEQVNAFGGCLDQEAHDKSTPTAQLMQLKTMQSRKLNAAVEELKEKAKLFNEQVRIYKARA